MIILIAESSDSDYNFTMRLHGKDEKNGLFRNCESHW